jgi:hypothetical protein
VTIDEVTDALAMWHSLDPPSLALVNSICEEEGELTGFGSCIELPLIISVDEGHNQETSPETICGELPISQVLHYLITKQASKPHTNGSIHRRVIKRPFGLPMRSLFCKTK